MICINFLVPLNLCVDSRYAERRTKRNTKSYKTGCSFSLRVDHIFCFQNAMWQFTCKKNVPNQQPVCLYVCALIISFIHQNDGKTTVCKNAKFNKYLFKNDFKKEI